MSTMFISKGEKSWPLLDDCNRLYTRNEVFQLESDSLAGLLEAMADAQLKCSPEWLEQKLYQTDLGEAAQVNFGPILELELFATHEVTREHLHASLTWRNHQAHLAAEQETRVAEEARLEAHEAERQALADHAQLLRLTNQYGTPLPASITKAARGHGVTSPR